MDLYSSRRGVALERLSGILGYNNSLHMIALWLKIGTPHSCLWAGDLGDELNLLSCVLNQKIVPYRSSSTCETSTALSLASTDGHLLPSSVYSPYPNFVWEGPVAPFTIPILFANGNHFQALIPPLQFDIFSL